MRLLVNGTSLSIGQMGPDFLLLDSAIDAAPTIATVVFRVDASERRWQVHLPHGIAADRARVAIERVTT